MNWSWILIALCLSQSAMFSGLNLAVFGIGRLRLEALAAGGNEDAARVLRMRRDANFLLTTILWGNVAANTLLALAAESVMTGFAAFFFSTFVITLLGEILPQAYFSRRALRVAAFFSPVLRFWQIVLWPVAKLSARLLDHWLGPEGVEYLREHDFREIIRRYMVSGEAELDHFEGTGALNFLELDDVPAREEGEPVHPESVLSFPLRVDLPVFPEFRAEASDPFLRQVHASGEKWVIVTDPDGEPRLVLDADEFLRAALLDAKGTDPYHFCHRPLVVRDEETPLGEILPDLRVVPERAGDDVIDRDIILVWGKEPRVITGSDILGRLLRGIVPAENPRRKRSAP